MQWDLMQYPEAGGGNGFSLPGRYSFSQAPPEDFLNLRPRARRGKTCETDRTLARSRVLYVGLRIYVGE